VLKQSLQRRFVCTLGFHRRLDLRHKGERREREFSRVSSDGGFRLEGRRERGLPNQAGGGLRLHRTWVAFAGHARMHDIGHGLVAAGAGLNQARDEPCGAACFTRGRRQGGRQGGQTNLRCENETLLPKPISLPAYSPWFALFGNALSKAPAIGCTTARRRNAAPPAQLIFLTQKKVLSLCHVIIICDLCATTPATLPLLCVSTALRIIPGVTRVFISEPPILSWLEGSV
jgi:hypothetical protein